MWAQLRLTTMKKCASSTDTVVKGNFFLKLRYRIIECKIKINLDLGIYQMGLVERQFHQSGK